MNFFRNLKIKTKFTMMIMIITLLLIVQGMNTTMEIGRVNTILQSHDEITTPKVIKILELSNDIIQIQQWLTDISATKAMPGFDDGFDEANKYYDDANSIIDELAKKEENPEKFKNLKKELDDYYNVGIEMANTYIQEGTDAGNLFMGEFDPFAEKLQNDLNQIIKEYKDDFEFEGTAIKKYLNRLKLYFIFISVLILLLVIFLSSSISGSVVKAINKTNDILKNIAQGEGDLTQTFKIKSKDEISKMHKLYNLFIEKIRILVSKVKDNVYAVSISSDQVSIAIEQANQGIESIATEISNVSSSIQNTANIIEETTASIEEIASSSQFISNEAKNVFENSKGALEFANNGEKNIIEVSDAINSVKESTDDIYKIIEELKVSSKEIDKIVSIITGISEQTNLLALNAAIEAARAGEHGKGFAIVADEVRKLAEESKRSAEEISLLINQIQNKTNDADVSIKEGQQRVIDSVDKSNDINRQFKNILESIQQITGKIERIFDSSKQQSQISQDMANAMNDISKTIQDNAVASEQINAVIEEQVSTFEEIGASIQELSSMTKLLKEETDRFKV